MLPGWMPWPLRLSWKTGYNPCMTERLNHFTEVADCNRRQLEQLLELSQTKALGFALDYARQYMNGKNTLKEIITQVKQAMEREGLDILSDRISGNFAWFRDIELALVLNRLRSVKMIQKENLTAKKHI